MTRHLTDRAQRLSDTSPVHQADGLTDPAGQATEAAATTPDAAPKDLSDKAKAAQTAPEADSPAMAQPSAMDYQAGFTSGR